MNPATLSPTDLALSAVLLTIMALLSWRMRLGLGQRIGVAAARMVVQLALIALVLEALFARASLIWVGIMSVVMIAAAGREVHARQRHRLKGGWGLGIGTVSMFVSSFSVTLLALTVIIDHQPWYAPQYAVPLLGMVLGNTMNGVALGLDRLNSEAMLRRNAIEARLMLGWRAVDAIADARREATRIGMIPILNAMAAAGLVSLPGMMTGQILAGVAPLEAVKYQIMVMFLIAGATGLGTLIAIELGARRLFDARERLRLDRLREVD